MSPSDDCQMGGSNKVVGGPINEGQQQQQHQQHQQQQQQQHQRVLVAN